MSNKVNVRIHGQEYTIVGEKSKEKILQIAAYVDEKIGEIYEASKIPTLSTLAVLSSVNIAEDSFAKSEQVEALTAENQRLAESIERYRQLWEETKKSFSEYKEENQRMIEQNKNLLNQLSEARDTAQKSMAENIKSEISEEMVGEIQEIESRYKELESNFFDLQMENIQLKSELEKTKIIEDPELF